MPPNNRTLSKVHQKSIVKRGRRGRKNNLETTSKEIPTFSTIYNNLTKPTKKTVPILAVKPTLRPLHIAVPEINEVRIEVITIDPPLEQALEERRVAIIEEHRFINEYDDSDAETVVPENEFGIDPDIELVILD